MTRFNLAEYETVDQRIHKFWKQHPNGRITTSLVGEVIEGRYIFRADVFREAADTEPAAVGWAEELQDASWINKTHPLENCETSAIGRALANLGLSKQGSRPSQEEMTKTARQATNAAKRRVLAAADGDVKLAEVLWQEATASLGHSPDDDLDEEEAEKAAGIAVGLAAEQAKLTVEKPSKETKA